MPGKDRKSREKSSGIYFEILRKLGIALLTSFILLFLFIYVNTGNIFYIPWEYVPSISVEFILFFIFLSLLFWFHGRIASFMNTKSMHAFPPVIRSAIEVLLVILITLALNYVVMFIPIFYLIGVEIDPPEGRVRTVTVISIFISLFFYYLIEREKSKKKLRKELLRSEQLQKENFRAQLNYLKSQMDPHFLFNSLNVLNSLIYVDQEKATAFTKQLAQVYRSFLEKSEQTLVSLNEELKLVQNYVALLQTRFGEDLVVKIEVPATCFARQLPPGAIQLLVENAVKHNRFTKREPLHIYLYTEEGKIVVKNNLQERKEEVSKSRHGLHNIKERYAFLTDREVEILQSDKAFIIKLPLLEKAQHENTDH